MSKKEATDEIFALVRTETIFEPAMTRAYRVGVADAFNCILDLVVEGSIDNEVGADEYKGLTRSLDAVFLLLKSSEKDHIKSLEKTIHRMKESKPKKEGADE